MHLSIAISFAAYQRYLVQRAATWERLALSRARLVAGDEELGRKVERCIRRYVFSQPINASTAAEVEQMCYRMEPSVRHGSSGQGQLEQVDIKRGPGGMVDIEFIAQILALHKGGKDAALRVGNTRQLLGLLTQKGHLSATQGRFLGRTYEQYRQLGKGMRIANDQAVNTLVPGQNIPFLERLVGANTETDLVEETKHLMKQTREVLKGVFGCLKEKGV
jgi:glutamate-ammonia-ligase adenylyltransferase